MGTYQGVVWVVGRLRNEQDGARLVVLQVAAAQHVLLDFSPLVALKDVGGARNMLEFVVFEDAERHGRDVAGRQAAKGARTRAKARARRGEESRCQKQRNGRHMASDRGC